MNHSSETTDLDLIGQYIDGSEDAAAELHKRYQEPLRRLIERNLASHMNRRLGSDDISQTVFRTWFRHLKEGVYCPAAEGVWGSLRNAALWKIRNKVKREKTQARDISREAHISGIHEVLKNPDDGIAVEMLDLIEFVTEKLRDCERETLTLLMEERTVREIATQLGVTTRSIDRYIATIRSRFESAMQDS